MYDVIVVGARCAGSPTAMLLAQRGYRVLLVDRAIFPSDMPMSTHYIWPPGVARLRDWGLLDEVAAHCPPVATVDVDLGPFRLVGSFPEVNGSPTFAHSPRRRILDQLLADAAVKAGVELREGLTVEDLVFDNGRVTGIRGVDAQGSVVAEEATLVVGADGPNSLIARLVEAVEYDNRDPVDGTAWSYWSGVSIPTMEFYPRERRAAYAWATGDDLVLVGVNWPAPELAELGPDIEAEWFGVLDVVAPGLAARLHDGHREERFRRGAVRNFFRRPHGPGWALVGDAGYNKSPFTAEGISDAFRDAERLTAAIDEGLSGSRPLGKALTTYEQKRNEAAKPFYEFTLGLAAMDPPPPEMISLFTALHGNQEQTDRFVGVFGQLISPLEFFAPENMERIFAGAP